MIQKAPLRRYKYKAHGVKTDWDGRKIVHEDFDVEDYVCAYDLQEAESLIHREHRTDYVGQRVYVDYIKACGWEENNVH